MGAIDPILEELTREAETTRRVIERLPADKLSWKPHEKSKTAGELAWHIATIPSRIASLAKGDDADVTMFKAPSMPATLPEILQAFDQHLSEAKVNLAKLGDEALARRFVMRIRERKAFAGPKLAYLRTVMLNHIYHHRGQLSVYLRLLNVPVPPVYGPTADEGT